MKKLREFFKEEMKNRWLMIILAVSFLIRIIGIDYALPFRISPDEVPSIYGALKMIELKTLIPVFHFEAFKNVTPYPPYISYIYLLPFSLFIGMKFFYFLFLGGDFHNIVLFKNFLISDLSPFFMIARLFSVIFGVATVYLVYKISKNMFKSETQAIFSALFLALSFLHISFSHWGRQWAYATFFFALIIYILSLNNYPNKKKYLFASLFAGIGMGVNYQLGISIFFIALWFLFCDKLPLTERLKQKWLYKILGLFAALSLGAIFLYPYSFYAYTGSFQSQIVTGQHWNLAGLLNIYKVDFSEMFKTEPIFLIFAVLGLVFSLLKNRGFFISVVCFSVIYLASFYLIFGTNEGRYLMMLYPLFAVSAGYGLYQFFEKSSFKFAGYILAFLSFSFMLVLAIKLDYLLFKNDTRAQAFEWIKNSLPRDSKIIVIAPYMRLPPNKESIDEQKNIDKKSIFAVDLAESNLDGKISSQPRYHVLNLYSVNNQIFLNNIGDYIKKQKYIYLIFNPNFADGKGAADLMNIGETIKVFEGFPGNGRIGDDIEDVTNDFGGGVINILTLKNNGPTIIIKIL